MILFVKKLIRYAKSTGDIYAYGQGKNPKLHLVNKYIAMVSTLHEFFELLKSICGVTTKPLKLFYFIQNDFWDNYSESNRYNNLVDKFVAEIGKNGIVDDIFDLVTSSYKLIYENNVAVDINLSLDIVVPSIDFLSAFIEKSRNEQGQALLFYKLERIIDDYLHKFTEKDANSNNIDMVFKLLQLREQLDATLRRLKLKTNFDIISFEDLKIQLIFYFLQDQNFIKQLTVTNILNDYKNRRLDKNLITHIIKSFIQKKVIDMLLGDFCNEELIKNLDPFFEFISPGLNYENLVRIFDIKAKANHLKATQIDQILTLLVKHINLNVI